MVTSKDKMKTVEGDFTLPQFTCTRCKSSWIPRKPVKPVICPKCKSPYWDKPRQNE